MANRNPAVHTTSQKAGSSPKPKKQHRTQSKTRESRNFHQGKSRNKKIWKHQETQTPKKEARRQDLKLAGLYSLTNHILFNSY
jgi:hypothetical protein